MKNYKQLPEIRRKIVKTELEQERILTLQEAKTELLRTRRNKKKGAEDKEELDNQPIDRRRTRKVQNRHREKRKRTIHDKRYEEKGADNKRTKKEPLGDD